MSYNSVGMLNQSKFVSSKIDDRMKNIEDKLDKVCSILGVLSKPSEEVLKNHASLKRAYEEYKVLEKLILTEEDNKK